MSNETNHLPQQMETQMIRSATPYLVIALCLFWLLPTTAQAQMTQDQTFDISIISSDNTTVVLNGTVTFDAPSGDDDNGMVAWNMSGTMWGHSVSVGPVNDSFQLAYSIDGNGVLTIDSLLSSIIAAPPEYLVVSIDNNGSEATCYDFENRQCSGASLRQVPVTFASSLVDDVAPVANPTYPELPSSGWYDSVVTVDWNWQDNAGGSGIDADNCETQSLASEQGAVTVAAQCLDLVGNSGNVSVTLPIDLFGPAPVPTFDPAPNEQGWFNRDVTVSLNWSDSHSGIDTGNCTQTLSLTDEAIDGEFAAGCQDNVGHFGGYLGSYNLDKQAPSTTFKAMPPTSTAADSAEFQFTSQDNLSGIAGHTCTVDNGTFEIGSPCTSPYTMTALANGTYTFTVTATDVAGNIEPPINHTWTVTNTPTAVTLRDLQSAAERPLSGLISPVLTLLIAATFWLRRQPAINLQPVTTTSRHIKLQLPVFFVGILLTTHQAANAQQRASIVVDSLQGSGADGICVLDDALFAADSDAAVNGCSAGDGADTITFSVVGTITLDFPLFIDSDVTINGGNNIVIDGGNTHRLFVVNAGTSVINGVTLQNGMGSADCDYDLAPPDFIECGGALKIEPDAALTINDSVVTGNRVGISGEGGAIHNSGTLNITNSTLSNNSGDTADESSFSRGGAIANFGTLNITNSTLSNNTAYDGGAINNRGGNASTTLANSTLSNNSATGNGGGVYNADFSTGNTLNVYNSTFSGNSGPLNGGGGINQLDTATIINSTFSNNAGGGIYNAGTTNISNSIFANSPTGQDCENLAPGMVILGGNNIIETNTGCGAATATDPNLATLAANTCTTQHRTPSGLACVQTHALNTGSLAIGAGNTTVCNAAPINDLDQRGISRAEANAPCDLGAFEVAGAPTAVMVREMGVSSQRVSYLVFIAFVGLFGATAIVRRAHFRIEQGDFAWQLLPFVDYPRIVC